MICIDDYTQLYFYSFEFLNTISSAITFFLENHCVVFKYLTSCQEWMKINFSTVINRRCEIIVSVLHNGMPVHQKEF